MSNDGAFLVRPSDNEPNAFVISFRAHKKSKHCRVSSEGRLFEVGSIKFESLVELINFYMKHPLYRTVKLLYPIPKDMLQRIGNMTLDDDAAYSGSEYMDLNNTMEKVKVKAVYDYKAQQDDELSFCKHAIIINVDKKENQLWWKGDYGGKKQLFFPANYVVEIGNSENISEENSCETGSKLLGSLDIHGAVVELGLSDQTNLECVLSIQNSAMENALEIGCETNQIGIQWKTAIDQAAQNASMMEDKRKEKEKNLRVAKEMSDLIIYFRSVPYKKSGWAFYEMFSFPEVKAEKYFLLQDSKIFLKYHHDQISRVYPKGQRVDSSNFNPIPLWNSGSQMLALNFQTPDKAMQLNQAKFRDNGNCGYILKPDFMFRENFDPNDPNRLIGIDVKTINIRIIGARHLGKSGRNISSPLVEVELLGACFDTGVKHRTVSGKFFFLKIFYDFFLQLRDLNGLWVLLS